MSKHGGSPESGLVQPVGLMALRPVNEGGAIIEPPEAVTARKDAAERRERALHFERRRVAMGLFPNLGDMPDIDPAFAEERIGSILKYADELIKQTGGVV